MLLRSSVRPIVRIWSRRAIRDRRCVKNAWSAQRPPNFRKINKLNQLARRFSTVGRIRYLTDGHFDITNSTNIVSRGMNLNAWNNDAALQRLHRWREKRGPLPERRVIGSEVTASIPF